jgi:hypothetical protein
LRLDAGNGVGIGGVSLLVSVSEIGVSSAMSNKADRILTPVNQKFLGFLTKCNSVAGIIGICKKVISDTCFS